MHITRALLSAGLTLIITGCNLSSIRPDQSAETSAEKSGPGARPAVTATTRGRAAAKVKTDIPGNVTTGKTAPTQQPDEINPAVFQDVWIRIGASLNLPRHLENRSVKDKLAWYRRNQDYLDRVADRARPYLYYVVEQLEKRGMPLELALLPIVESAYHPFAYSPSKASGIWQFIPSTGTRYGLKQNWWYDGRRDIVAATRAALDYLEMLHKEFNGDWLLALAAYNAGEKNVARSVSRNMQAGKKQDFFSLSLPNETRGYVPSLLAVAELVANPAQHGVSWKPIPDTAYFSQVDTGGQLDLALVAELTDQSMDEVYTLNPGYNRWATDPDGPHTLLIPLDKAEPFKTRLAELPEAERISWNRHIIKTGESLGQIAAQYHTSIEALKSANGISGNLIRAGASLLIPTSRRPAGHYSLSMDARRFQGLKKTGTGQEYVYTVQRGDTLWDIGQHYGISVQQLSDWNGISPSRLLQPGQKLTLWLAEDGKALMAGEPAAARVNPGTLARTSAGEGYDGYTVKSGDSLWLIASRNHLTVAQIAEWNDLTRSSVIKPGQVLNLKAPVTATAAGNTYGVGDLEADSGQDFAALTSYTVKSGDSLWQIARRYGMTVSQLMDLNNLVNGNQLKPGQQLNLIPASLDTGKTMEASIISYTVKKGDSLWQISRRFGTTVAQLVRWNNLSSTQHLKPGQKLVLYMNEA